MVSVVSSNNASQITALGFTQIGLNSDENDLILDSYPKDQFIRANANYQICLDHIEDIAESLRPSLKKYMEGPFILTMYNHGDEMTKSMLIFDIQSQKKQDKSGNIIIDDPNDFTNKSLCIFPFVDLFRKEIEKEAERAAKLLNAGKVTSLNDVRARRDAEMARSMTEMFFKHINSDKAEQGKVALGKEAVSDTLASSLSAQNDFYNHLWKSMIDFFNPSFRYLGEQHALGKTNLESMQAIISPQSKDDPIEPS